VRNEVYNDCPRHGNGEPKRPDQLKRRQENRCVYCGTSKSESLDLLGPACSNKDCQEKRWAESKLTDKQECVIKGIFDGWQDKEIADKIHVKTVDGVRPHKRAIAKKFGVRCDRVLLARCYMERQRYMLP
jgi:DNA-binding NarL/FixJ family response regulator